MEKSIEKNLNLSIIALGKDDISIRIYEPESGEESLDDKSFEKNIAGCEVSFTEDGFSLNYGGDCCYGRMAEIAVT